MDSLFTTEIFDTLPFLEDFFVAAESFLKLTMKSMVWNLLLSRDTYPGRKELYH